MDKQLNLLFILDPISRISVTREKIVCKSCGRLGHVALQCHYYTSEPNAKSLDNATSQVMELQKQEPMEEDWKRVSFAKTKKKSTRPTTTSINVQAVPV